MALPDYYRIVEHYESCLQKYGDTNKGVDWPDLKDAETRYRIMLEVVKYDIRARQEPGQSLLDFGCGAGHLLDYIQKNELDQFKYFGIDISKDFIEVCRRKHPNSTFFLGDVLRDEISIPRIDYVIMNGVFTEKVHLSHERMFEYTKQVLEKAFKLAERGVAFNVMSKHVDWERDDLFHLPHDELVSFLVGKLSRNFVIRNDYGLYEYTVYLYR